MVEIVAVAIGYGTKEGVEGYTMLGPKGLEEIRRELKGTGVNIRDVLGYIPFDVNNPNSFAMVNNPPGDVQKDTTVGKGVLGSTTPLGGKVDGLYKTMAEAGIITIEQAYAARGFVGEMDELGGPNKLALELLNRTLGFTPGLLTSPDGNNLFVNSNFVREFKQPGLEQRVVLDENCANYDPLTKAVATLAIGLNKDDQKKGIYNATTVANVWIPASPGELFELAEVVRGLTVDGISTLELVDSRSFPNKNETPVSNMLAFGLLTSNSDIYDRATGLTMPDNVARISDMPAFDKATRHENKSIREMVDIFRSSI